MRAVFGEGDAELTFEFVDGELEVDLCGALVTLDESGIRFLAGYLKSVLGSLDAEFKAIKDCSDYSDQEKERKENA